jgi:hypothetical protein
MKALTRRLLRLEARFGAMAEATRTSAVPSGAQQIAEWLGAWGIVRECNESLAETTARAMGWSMAELRSALQRRADGLPV